MRTVFKLGFVFSVIAITSTYSFAATDVLFLIDTTGSMSGIENVKTALNGIIAAIDANAPCSDTIMYGVADYRNYVDGGNYSAYGVNLDQPFTSSLLEAMAALDGLTTGNGGDEPESQLKAMVTITENWLTPSGDLGFNGRANAQKILIWSGDMPGHVAGDESGGSPPEGYYPTLDATIAALTDQWITVFALNLTTVNAGLDKLHSGHHQASEITAATGGILFNNVGSGGSWIEDPIVEAITCVSLDKDDDLDDENPSDCRQPGQELTYTLYYANDDDETLQNAFIIDWLSPNVTYPDGEWTFGYDPNASPPIVLYPPDPGWDGATNSYAWALGPIDPNASGSVQLTVTVNEAAAPGTYLHNLAELWGTVYVHDPNDPNRLVPEVRLVARAVLDTPVCCYITPPQTLYVDKTATGGAQTGVDWQNAFLTLQDAIACAEAAVCGEVESIYVAQGTYSPGDSEDDSFDLTSLPGISLYGGFKPGGCPLEERNPTKYPTVLSGTGNL
ncbi:MAG TPA: VWA domain-containing protein [Anaerohalosphaeraceae bacterium]|nr:VWA domain-containing protein [Anaerohalosphaeraceae bacterium]